LKIHDVLADVLMSLALEPLDGCGVNEGFAGFAPNSNTSIRFFLS
jgi:hypothetical protein